MMRIFALSYIRAMHSNKCIARIELFDLLKQEEYMVHRALTTIEEYKPEIVYFARSWIGSWSVHLKNKDNVTGRGIQGYSMVSNEILEQIKQQGIKVFDFYEIEDFRPFR